MRCHRFAEGVDGIRGQISGQRQGSQRLGRRRGNVLMNRRDGMEAAGQLIDEGLNQDRCFMADNMSSQDILCFLGWIIYVPILLFPLVFSMN